MALQSTTKTGGPRRPAPILASLLLSSLLFVASVGALAAQGSGVSLVNESARFVERNKEGGFIARPVFDRPLAFLGYAVRDPDSGDWLTGVTQVQGGEKRLSNGWERSWEYPGHDDQPELDPKRIYVLFMMAAETTPGEPDRFHVVIPAHEPTGIWERVIGALDPSRWARAFARWVIEGVHGTLCGVVERASGANADECRGG